MKKIFLLISAIISSTLFLSSCSDSDYQIPAIVSDKYVVATENFGASETVSLYVKASNSAGGVNISIPNADGTSQNMFIKNEELESTLKMVISMAPDILKSVKNVNYIDFVSNFNLRISYKDAAKEILIPDMLSDDGACVNGLKYRKSFDRIFIRFSEKFSRKMNMPFIGEMPEPYSLIHRTDEKGFLLSAPKITLNNYVTMLSSFGVDPSIVNMIKDILAQYKTSNDNIEIGVYLKKVN